MFRSLVLSLVALTSSVAAQSSAGEFSPNPVPVGSTMIFTLTDATGVGLFFSTPCFWSIHAGAPNGPIVADPALPLGICTQEVVMVPPNGSLQIDWDLKNLYGNQVVPGNYWIEIDGRNPLTFEPFTDFFCFSIVDPTILPFSPPPLLTYTAPARVGTSAPFQIDAPNFGGAFYFVGASFTANDPLVFEGQLLCLSPDALFDVSLLSPSIAMTNSLGLLDGLGQASGSLDVPSNPSFAYRGVQLQGFVASTVGPSLLATNGLSITIQP